MQRTPGGSFPYMLQSVLRPKDLLSGISSGVEDFGRSSKKDTSRSRAVTGRCSGHSASGYRYGNCLGNESTWIYCKDRQVYICLPWVLSFLLWWRIPGKAAVLCQTYQRSNPKTDRYCDRMWCLNFDIHWIRPEKTTNQDTRKSSSLHKCCFSLFATWVSG